MQALQRRPQWQLQTAVAGLLQQQQLLLMGSLIDLRSQLLGTITSTSLATFSSCPHLPKKSCSSSPLGQTQIHNWEEERLVEKVEFKKVGYCFSGCSTCHKFNFLTQFERCFSLVGQAPIGYPAQNDNLGFSQLQASRQLGTSTFFFLFLFFLKKILIRRQWLIHFHEEQESNITELTCKSIRCHDSQAQCI